MKKNNKGFTLIELLAAIVILGLLAMLGLPTITRVIQGGKDKIYVSDAKRMIAQTEYKIKVNNSTIELPGPTECIVVGLQYLDASDFDNPPGDGTYMLDQSYTIIKNNGTGLEYSARLVESMKGNGYKGVELSTQTALNVDSGLKRVKTFKSSEVATDMLNSGTDVFTEPIKKNIKDGYCSRILNIYNNVDLDDSSIQTGNEPPKITSVSFETENNSIYNTINATLKVKADDSDNARKDLSVCTSFDSYEEAMRSCSRYGNHPVFSKKYDFSIANPPSSYSGDDENPEYTIYIYLKDPNGGYAKKKITYQVHKNEAPVIDVKTSKITARNGDSYNDLTARITLNATDDLDSVANLGVCIIQDDNKDCQNDNEYTKYSVLFGNGNAMDYTLQGVDGLDGSSHSFRIFVRDTMGLTSEVAKFDYTLYKPNYNISGDGTAGSHITLTPISYKNVKENSLKVDVSFDLLDSLGAVANKDVIISERVPDSNTYIHRMAYRFKPGTNYTYLFGNVNGSLTNSEYTYDGHKNRRLDVMVCPRRSDLNPNNYNPAQCNREEVGYDIHLNQSPKVEFGRFVSDENLCPNGYICNAESNTHFESLRVDYILHIEDDSDIIDLGDRVEESSDLRWCISESSSGCDTYRKFTGSNLPFTKVTRDHGTTKKYTIYGKHTFTATNPLTPYDGVNNKRNLYFYIRDSYGLVSVVSSRDNYMLYTNEAPYIDLLEVNDAGSTGVQSGSKKVAVKPLIYSDDHLFSRDDYSGYDYLADDLTDNKYIAYKLYSLGTYNNRDRCTWVESLSRYECVYAELTRDQINAYKANPRTNWDNVLTFDKLLRYPNDSDNPGYLIDLNDYGFKYNGEIINFVLELTDEYGLQSTYSKEYTLYSNKPPTIDRALISSSEPACDTCGESGGYNVKLDISISDDIDDESNLSVCVSDDEIKCLDDSNFISYTTYFKNNDYEYTFTGLDGLTPYNGQTKLLHVAAMDSLGDKSYEVVEYTVYNNQAPIILRDPIISSSNDNYHSTDAIAEVSVKDDLGNLYERVCYKELDSDNQEIGQMMCDGDFKPYTEEFRFNLGVTNYTGKSYNVYVEIKDAYDQLVRSNPVRYTTYTDQKPVVDSVTGRYNVTGYASGAGRVSFKAHDFGDTYKICITKSSSGSGCNYYGNYYDGSYTDAVDYTYSFGSNSKTDTYYIFLKDNHGKISDGVSFKFTEFSSCSSYNTSMIKYDYQSVGSTVINADTCSGRCYYWPEEKVGGKVVKPASDTSNIKARYKETISYRDTFSDTTYCNSTVNSNYTLTCGSIECFNDGNTYNGHIAVGLVDYIATEAWTYEKDGKISSYSAGSHYFKVYTTQLKPGSNEITLYDTGNRVPLDDIDYYNYSNGYYRVLDKDGITSDYVNSNVTFKFKFVSRQNPDSITVGDRVQAGTEEFYVIYSDSNDTKLLAKYNLYAGSIVDAETGYETVEVPYYRGTRQNSDYIGKKNGLPYYKGVTSTTDTSNASTFPANIMVPTTGTLCEMPFRYYSESLKQHGLSLEHNIRLMTYAEAQALGCRTNISSSCPSWVTNTSYWLGTYSDSNHLYGFLAGNSKIITNENTNQILGCRPVVVIHTYEIG